MMPQAEVVLFYNETFANSINNGSWNVMLGQGDIGLPLEFGKEYFKDYVHDALECTEGQVRAEKKF